MENHDLSADSVTLDYDALLDTAIIAVRGARTSIERYYGEIQNAYLTKKSMVLTSQWLAREAQSLATAIETLEALEGMRTRNEFNWKNKPEMKD